MYSNNTYNVDFKRLVLHNLNAVWQKPVHVSWLNALMQPIISLYSLFLVFRKTTFYQLGITPQVCYLEKLLNDKYDTEQRRIYIDEPPEKEGVPLYQEAEAKPQVLYTEAEMAPFDFILWQESESQVFSVDFIVVVPIDVLFDLNELRALVNAYKLVTKTYKVQTI